MDELCCFRMTQCLEKPVAKRQGLVEVDSRKVGGARYLAYRHPQAGPFTSHSAHVVKWCPFCGSELRMTGPGDWRDLAKQKRGQRKGWES